MLGLNLVHVIRHKVLVEERSERRVAREMGISRNTVRKYLGESEPRRKEEGPRGRPVLDKVRNRMESILEEWKERTTRKQRVTGSRLHKQLVVEGYRVGITTVRGYLRERRRKSAEVFVPLVHHPGDEAQVDFFDVTVDLEAGRERAWLFVMRLMYSGRDFAWIYEHCDQVSFLDGHVRAFDHFRAVPQRVIYDNLAPAVRRVVLPKRELTERFEALVSHYLFEPCFARVGEGHDKGGVEARGRGIRLQELTPIPEGRSLREISRALLERLDDAIERRRNDQGQTVAERFAQERPRMLPLPPAFEARKVEPVSVSSSALVRIGGASYSVPTRWARLTATAYMGPEDVRIVCRGEDVIHSRQRFGSRSIRYRHYLPELAEKPQALRQVAGPLLEELGEPFGALWRLLVDAHGPREAARVMARVLGAIAERGEASVSEAVRQALRTDRLEQVLLLVKSEPKLLTIEVPEPLSGYIVESARAEDFDSLLGGADYE